jgi:hypothetical protein
LDDARIFFRAGNARVFSVSEAKTRHLSRSAVTNIGGHASQTQRRIKDSNGKSEGFRK